MNIAQIQISRRQLFDNFSNSLHDLVIVDKEQNDFHMLGDLADAQKTVQLFRQGFAPMMLHNDMARVEHLVENEMPFVIIITNDDAIFAVINGDEVTY